MVGAASLAAACLSVVIGAISQGFGGVYQDRLSFADYSSGTNHGASCRVIRQKGPDYDPRAPALDHGDYRSHGKYLLDQYRTLGSDHGWNRTRSNPRIEK